MTVGKAIFSEHWMVFYLVPMLYFLFGVKKGSGAEAPSLLVTGRK